MKYMALNQINATTVDIIDFNACDMVEARYVATKIWPASRLRNISVKSYYLNKWIIKSGKLVK